MVVFVVSAVIVAAIAPVLAADAEAPTNGAVVLKFLPALLIENFNVAAAVSVTALPTFAATTNFVVRVVTSEVPSAGDTVIAEDACAGAPAITDEPRANSAPSARPLRVRFLDMISFSYSWFVR
jgi:hypothetical protein